jgi:hypothetical protein
MGQFIVCQHPPGEFSKNAISGNANAPAEEHWC